MGARHRRRIDDKLAKIGKEWSLNDCSANTGRGKVAAMASKTTSEMVVVALCTAQHEAERLPHEQHTTAEQGCRCPPVLFRHWRDHDDDNTDDYGVRRQGVHAYEVVVWYGV
ncbi:hypothetical protein D1007_28705 [Hordeum vulgare]|nr:hypothetical protein D1007_28705 [Hordeum vulgare]